MGCESAEFSVAHDNNVRCRVCVGAGAAYWAPLMADDLCRRLADHAGGPSHRANAARWRSTGRIVLTAPSAAPAADNSRPLKRHCVGYLGARELVGHPLRGNTWYDNKHRRVVVGNEVLTGSFHSDF